MEEKFNKFIYTYIFALVPPLTHSLSQSFPFRVFLPCLFIYISTDQDIYYSPNYSIFLACCVFALFAAVLPKKVPIAEAFSFFGLGFLFGSQKKNCWQINKEIIQEAAEEPK